MKPSLQKILKILKFEAEQHYENRAVIGGLSRILSSWEPEARSEGVPEELIQAISDRLRDYSRLSETARHEVLEGIWRRLHRENGTVAPPLPGLEQNQPAPAASSRSPVKAAKQEDPDDQLLALPEEPPQVSLPSSVRSINQPVEPAALKAPVTVLQDVGPKHAQTLERLGLRTLHDMLYYLPRRYDDYSQLKSINRLKFGEEVTVIGTVQSLTSRQLRSGKNQVVEAVVHDGTGAMRVTWFNPWTAKRLHNGAHVSLSGKVDQYLGRLVMKNPEWEPLEQLQLSTNRIVPVYPLTAQITQRWLRKLMGQVITHWAPRVPDYLPENVRTDAGVIDLPNALLQAHFPDSQEILKAARYRLAFDEVFFLQLGVLGQKRLWQDRSAQRFAVDEDWFEAQLARLPYTLTGAQQRALVDIRQDLASGQPMNRLLQGDVGSGKTLVAGLAAAIVTGQSSQAAYMAPTSILAEQQYKNMLKLLAEPGSDGAPGLLLPEHIRLLVGATTESERQSILAGLRSGEIRLIVGTHALIEEPVQFADFQLAIIDEQHRFGVEQRAALRSKGSSPHLLVMTATPIPRSLALTIYGDLDVSIMDEMPPGRLPVNTYVITPLERERAYRLIQSQISTGNRAFIVYPLVEESENSESKAAVEEFARLQEHVFPNQRLGLLHGRMLADDKDAVMRLFSGGEVQILVSTSVIEVGVDVPEASVMLIEGANRFGLAQLHQFRGRVGRGNQQAYCLLIPETPDAAENERLQAMCETNDGFVLAEKDLQQRGPGDFFGTRQAGMSELQFASLTDIHLIDHARRQAVALFEKDPVLDAPEHQLLKTALDRFWSSGKGDVS